MFIIRSLLLLSIHGFFFLPLPFSLIADALFQSFDLGKLRVGDEFDHSVDKKT
jgi:hypothetical protein